MYFPGNNNIVKIWEQSREPGAGSGCFYDDQLLIWWQRLVLSQTGDGMCPGYKLQTTHLFQVQTTHLCQVQTTHLCQVQTTHLCQYKLHICVHICVRTNYTSVSVQTAHMCQYKLHICVSTNYTSVSDTNYQLIPVSYTHLTLPTKA